MTKVQNKIKRKPSERAFNVFNITILVLFGIVCLYPMIYVAFASFSDSSLLMKHTGLLWKPIGFSLAAYKKVFSNSLIWSGYGNTIFILVVGVFLDLIMTSLAAYVLSRKNVMWRKPVTMFITFTMFFAGGMIPFYLNLQDLGLLGTRWGLIIPFLISTYNMIILRTSFAAIPESLFEAAHIDGAGHTRVLFQIVIPLSKAVLAVMILYYGVSIWNAWFWASSIRLDRTQYPLQVILREILIQNSTASMTAGGDPNTAEAVGQSIKYATIMVATVPILAIYPFLQRYFESGVMIGAVKE